MPGSKIVLSRYIRHFLLLASLIPLQAQAVDPGVLAAAQTMLNQGQALDALDLLKPHEEDYAGDTQYDYLYGLALFDTGEASSAVFAFQRALAVEPNFAGARLELARSYFEMGQLQRSQREFTLLQNQSPPSNVRDVIDKYLAAIENRSLRNKRGWRGFLQLGIGDDSNVNSGPATQPIPGITLPADNLESSSSVISTLGGVSYDLPLGIDSKLFFKASVNHRANNDASAYSTVNYDALVGYALTLRNQDELSTAIQIYTADLDGESNNKGLNLTGQYSFNLSSNNQIGTFVRLGQVDYEDENDVRDIDQALLGLSWSHVFGGQSRISTVISLLGARDEPKQDGSEWGRDYTGVRLSLAYPVTHRLNLFTSLGSTNSDYDGVFLAGTAVGSSENRSDEYVDVAVGASWRASKTWLLRMVVSQAENDSNTDFYDYDRTQIMLTARSEFAP
jgi:tetratricopeptide (TPR) repeat protein